MIHRAQATPSRCVAMTALTALALVAGLIAAIPANADDRVVDAGTFQSALTAASDNSGPDTITVAPGIGEIEIGVGLVYQGDEPLTIRGNGATLVSASEYNGDLITTTGNADLTITGLRFRTCDYPACVGTGKALFMEIPASATGVVEVALHDVHVYATGQHGIHLRDCAENPGGTGEEEGWCILNDHGSAASIHLSTQNVTVTNGGFGEIDQDGIRVDERSEGDIVATFANTDITHAGGDGIELDEEGDGDIRVFSNRMAMRDNGAWCASQEPQCDDPDDGLDVDEYGAGGIYTDLRFSSITGTKDEAIDVSEHGDGDAVTKLFGTTVANTDDENLRLKEFGPGSNIFEITLSTVSASTGDDGLQAEEEDAGNISGHLVLSDIRNNTKDGVKLEESGNGAATLTALLTSIADNSDGIDVSESGEGNLGIKTTLTESYGNSKDGIAATETGPGSANLETALNRITANGDDGIQIAETGDGNLRASMLLSRIASNGGFWLKLEHEQPGTWSMQRLLADVYGNDNDNQPSLPAG